MDKRINFLLWACVILLPVVSAGCAGGQARKTVPGSILSEDDLPRSLLDMVFSRYRNYTRSSFEELVSRDFTPARAEFVDAVEGKVFASRVLELNYVIEKSLRTGDQVIISFSWDKKQAPTAGGNLALVSGRTEFTFQKTPGGWGLLQVQGDDPF